MSAPDGIGQALSDAGQALSDAGQALSSVGDLIHVVAQMLFTLGLEPEFLTETLHDLIDQLGGDDLERARLPRALIVAIERNSAGHHGGAPPRLRLIDGIRPRARPAPHRKFEHLIWSPS